jgi:hypothetical protein
MAKRITKEQRQERIKALVAALLAAEEGEGSDVRGETIDDIERTMIRIGDAVAREVGVQKLARHTGDAGEPRPCPRCGQAGLYSQRRERRLISSRGPVPLTEATYRCPKCRRDFFPSDGLLGD